MLFNELPFQVSLCLYLYDISKVLDKLVEWLAMEVGFKAGALKVVHGCIIQVLQLASDCIDLINASAAFGAQAAHHLAQELYSPSPGASCILSERVSNSLSKIL